MTATTAVARLSGPVDLVAAVPHLCGFTPADSLVVIALRPPRGRVGLTLRLDLPEPGEELEAAEEVATRVARDRAAEAVLLVYTEAGDNGQRPAQRLVAAVSEALSVRGVGVRDALLVRDRRVWSLWCRDPRCCPPEGVALPERPSPGIEVVAAAHALAGQAVLGSREDLVASLAPPSGAEAAAAHALARVLDHGADLAAAPRLRQGRIRAWDSALSGSDQPALDPDRCVELAVALGDVVVRDQVLSWAPAEEERVLAVLRQVVRQVVAPHDAPACTVLAVLSWARGEGAVTNVALERALASNPRYRLALMLREAVDDQVEPKLVREWLESLATSRQDRRSRRRRR